MGGAHEWSPMPGLIRAFALDVLNVVCGSTSQRREAGAVTPPLTAPASRLTLIEYCPIFGCAVAGYNDRALQFGNGKRATFCPERSSGVKADQFMTRRMWRISKSDIEVCPCVMSYRYFSEADPTRLEKSLCPRGRQRWASVFRMDVGLVRH